VVLGLESSRALRPSIVAQIRRRAPGVAPTIWARAVHEPGSPPVRDCSSPSRIGMTISAPLAHRRHGRRLVKIAE